MSTASSFEWPVYQVSFGLTESGSIRVECDNDRAKTMTFPTIDQAAEAVSLPHHYAQSAFEQGPTFALSTVISYEYAKEQATQEGESHISSSSS